MGTMDFKYLEDFLNEDEAEESAAEWLWPRSLRAGMVEGESSGSGPRPEALGDVVAMSVEEWEGRDLHHKRAKVQSGSV